MCAVSLAVLTSCGTFTNGFAQDRPPVAGSLAGTWALDPYLSDHPQQVARALRINMGEPLEDLFAVPPGVAGRGGERGGGGASEKGGRGGAEGAEPPGTARGQQKDAIAEAERKLLMELTAAIRFPPLRMTIQRAETTVTLTTGATEDVLQTNGRAEERKLGAGIVERTASWQGPNLVVAYEVERAGTLTYTYSLAPTTRQLVIRVTFEREQGQAGPFEIKLIYNPVAPDGVPGGN
jgi:hypothetical protein